MRIIIVLALLLLLILPVDVFSGSDDKGNTGKQLYDAFCARCHGFKGDGKGYDSGFRFPKPRDFILGTYKFRSTPVGEPPTDDDIIRSIRRGSPETSMQAWERFSNDEVKALADYLKSFSPEIFELSGEPIKIGEAPAATDETLAKGRKLFEEAKCRECHGRSGRGNGEKAWKKGFKDDWGEKIYPANLTHLWERRNGSNTEDLYRTITTGLAGTPMASYLDSYTDEQRWALACYVRSLRIKRRPVSVLKAGEVENIPSSIDDELWDKAYYIDIPLEGRETLIFTSQYFNPMITNMRVRVLYTDSELAIMLEWSDRKPDRGDDGLPPDAVRLQFPSKIPSDTERPYYHSGDREVPLNLWYWKASDNLALELNAYGAGEESIIQQEQMDVKALSNYSNGLYRVILRRQIETKDKDDISFSSNRFIPFSVAAYDGRNNEKGYRAAVSGCYYIKFSY